VRSPDFAELVESYAVPEERIRDVAVVLRARRTPFEMESPGMIEVEVSGD